jgi:hypothetical protein
MPLLEQAGICCHAPCYSVRSGYLMVTAKTSTKSISWAYFDYIVAQAAPKGIHSNPWVVGAADKLSYEPDFQTLERLLGVPLYLKATTQSGVPALALDVWISYELRRAGFTAGQVWPRPQHPRVVSVGIDALIKSLPVKGNLKKEIENRVYTSASIKGVTSSSAVILGKNYTKQVDVIISDWSTGPELLVSTKRMDSSYGKNAANRIEESYGDAKNLRLRYPLAALGFAFGLRSDILQKEPKKAKWIFDLLTKLGQEDDAYHATCLVLMEYTRTVVPKGQVNASSGNELLAPGPEPEKDEDLPAKLSKAEIANAMSKLPKVSILHELTPEELAPGRFLAMMVSRVLAATPINMHEDARARRESPASLTGAEAKLSQIR